MEPMMPLYDRTEVPGQPGRVELVPYSDLRLFASHPLCSMDAVLGAGVVVSSDEDEPNGFSIAVTNMQGSDHEVDVPTFEFILSPTDAITLLKDLAQFIDAHFLADEEAA
jgi:hypothetical protein